VTTLRSPEFRRASGRVLRWTAWYTRDLDPDVANERLDEIASDLHEHAESADRAGSSPRALARSITGRGLRGALDDLSWRRDKLREGAGLDPRDRGSSRSGTVVGSAVAVLAAAVLAGGGLSLARVIHYWIAIQDDAVLPALITLAAAVVGGCLGLALLVLPRMRWVGASVMAVASAAMVHSAFAGLLYGSALVNWLITWSPGWPIPKHVLAVSLAVFFLAAAMWWWPSRSLRRAATVPREGSAR
jgi:hypothetical protein